MVAQKLPDYAGMFARIDARRQERELAEQQKLEEQRMAAYQIAMDQLNTFQQSPDYVPNAQIGFWDVVRSGASQIPLIGDFIGNSDAWNSVMVDTQMEQMLRDLYGETTYNDPINFGNRFTPTVRGIESLLGANMSTPEARDEYLRATMRRNMGVDQGYDSNWIAPRKY